MLSFAAEFPVSSERTSEDFIDAVKEWILGSPHTVFISDDLLGIGGDKPFEISRMNQSVKSLAVKSGLDCLIGVRHTTLDGDIEWILEAIFNKNALEAWVAVRTSREAESSFEVLPAAKKPVIVRVLLEKLGGGIDGELNIGSAPRILSNNDIKVPADIILGNSAHYLPVVYVSCRFDGSYGLDARSLAFDLAGMAHVVVEPNRPFSYRLQIEVASGNAYGGVIGIYWPDASGSRSLFKPINYKDRYEIKNAVVNAVRQALMNRRPLYNCTWTYVQEAFSKQAYDALKSSGSSNIDDYVAVFDQEIKSQDQKIATAEREIARLRSEIKRYEHQATVESGINLKISAEQEFEDNEFLEILVEILKETKNNLMLNSRKEHIVMDIIMSNAVDGNLQIKRDKIRNLFRDYKSMDARTKADLQDIGFSLSEEGKHYKAVYRDDGRYTFSISKTSSDRRSGLNLASDIIKIIL